MGDHEEEFAPVLWKQSMVARKAGDSDAEHAALDAAAALVPVSPRSPHFDEVRAKVEARRVEVARSP